MSARYHGSNGGFCETVRVLGWCVVSGSGTGGAKPDGLVILRNQNQTLF